MAALPAIGNARFLIRRCLGSGGFGTVYEAFDGKRHATVALKVLHAQDPDGLYHFKREFRAVSGISHPNLVTLYELATDGAAWFISMELLDGIEVLSYVRGARPDTAESLAGSLPHTH